MRKLFILTVAIAASTSGFAQKKSVSYAQPVNSVVEAGHYSSAGRTTSTADTLTNINPLDTLTIYHVGTGDTSGYATGTNVWNDLAFAERYTVSETTAVQISGVLAEFAGRVNPASGKTVTFAAWDIGTPDIISFNTSYNGFPADLLDTVSAPVTRIGIGATADTMKAYLFATPAYCPGSFFVGYGITYNFSTLDGDTLGLACTKNGVRLGDSFTVIQEINDFGDTWNDTIINVQNATLQGDFNWYDNYTQNDSLYNNLAIFPIVTFVTPSGVSSVKKNNLTFFGNYPNPASDVTNVKCSLAYGADITIEVMDLDGRILSTIKQNNLAAGPHIIPVNTSNMASGNYLYILRTSGGDGVAGKMTVIH